MAKPRIIIADTDASYIIPLLGKFMEDFYDDIELEAITNIKYFEQLFSVPQEVDILIVSEDFYRPDLRRHHISHVFLLVEQVGEKTIEIDVESIYKYSNIKTVFNEIVGKSKDVFKNGDVTGKETQVIVVSSASGGAGKTTVAMGISGVLAQNYKRVLYINAERLQTFQHLLADTSAISTTDTYVKLMNATDSIYTDIKMVIRKETFHYLPPFKTSLMSLGISYSIYERIITSAKKSREYDYIIVDTDTTFDEGKASLLYIANKVLVVTNQTKASVLATNIWVSNVNGVNSEKYIFISNGFKREQQNVLPKELKYKFPISEEIEHFSNYEQMRLEDLLKETSIQKVAFLIS